jgi:2'-5' RNA ligase
VKFRAFLAVDLDGAFGAGKVLTELRTSGADLKLVETKNLHLTLKFLGDTDESRVDDIRRAMEESVRGIAPFELRFHGLGVFPNQNYIRVVWIGLKGAEPLALIAQRLDESLSRSGFGKDGSFSPHLTVARVKSPRNRDRLVGLLNERESDDFGKTTVGKIALKRSVLSSTGPTYTTVEEVTLGLRENTGEPGSRETGEPEGEPGNRGTG